MKVLVLGGTGAIGVHLIQLLSGNGFDITITSRTQRDSIENLRHVKGDANDLSFLQSLLGEQWDAIVDFMVYTTSNFKERVNLLLSATSQYVFLSSARVYANSVEPITEISPRLLDVSEDQEFLLSDEYSLTKARQEDILRNSGLKNWTIIRPYITYSENRLQLGALEKEEWLYRALHGRAIVFSSDIASQATTLTYGLDVSNGINSVIGVPSALGEIFHITTNDSSIWIDILSLYLKVLEKHLGYMPKIVLLNFEKFLECKPAKYQILYDRLYNRRFDSSKIGEYIDINNFTRPEIGLTNCVVDFLKKPRFNTINWKSEALKDKQAGEHTPLSEIQSFKQKINYLIARYFL